MSRARELSELGTLITVNPAQEVTISGLSSGVAFAKKVTAYTASANDGIIADTSSGAWVLTLPASPSVGDLVVVRDGGSWSSFNLTVGRNGSTIDGVAEDLVMDVADASVELLYDGTTWGVHAQAGLVETNTSYAGTSFTATASQTVFTTAYTVGRVDVFLNGIKLPAEDFTASNGTSITLAVAADVNDTLEVIAWEVFVVANAATAAQGTLAASALQPTGDGSSLTGINSFAPVAVTGTAPSLDVGTYNFFDNSTLTGNTSPTFASVPTTAKWKYSCKTPNLDVWDISTSVLAESVKLDTNHADTVPTGLFFKPDGTRMYICGDTQDSILEYHLDTPWDVGTQRYVAIFAAASADVAPEGLFFKPDGLKMFTMADANNAIQEWSLSIAWDISTLTYTTQFVVSSQETTGTGLFFKPDGTKLYVTGRSSDRVHEYDLSTAWLISSSVLLQSFDISAKELNVQDVQFSPDGLKMYIIGSDFASVDEAVHEYTLSTAWNVTTATFIQSFTIADEHPSGIFFKPDGTQMFVMGRETLYVLTYDIGSPTTVTLPAAVVGTPSVTAHNSRATYEFFTLDGGTTVNLIGEEII